jgi:hypothetical protein
MRKMEYQVRSGGGKQTERKKKEKEGIRKKRTSHEHLKEENKEKVIRNKKMNRHW